jgi:hypothetical protein
MERRSVLRAGWLAAAGAYVSACDQRPTVSHESAAPNQPMASPTPAPAAAGTRSMGSLPDKFVVGPGKGLQLFFHGLCSFVLPKTSSEPLRVAMLKAYPDDKAHRHFASLVVPRGGVDLVASDAEPSGVDGDHITYSLKDIYVSLSTAGVSTPVLRINNAPMNVPCSTAGSWDNFGWVLSLNQLYPTGTRA